MTQIPSSWGLSNVAQEATETKTIWNFYTEQAYHYDDDLVKDANSTVDVLLVFVSTATLSLPYG